MNTIQLSFSIGDEYRLKSVSFVYNDTDLPDDSTTLKNLAVALLKSLKINQDSVMVQDLLNELDIKTN
jgi:hypothetical protein